MQVKAYQPGDEQGIEDLFNAAFKRRLPGNFWEWRFRHNPLQEQPMIDLMWDDGVMAGHYAVSAIELMVDGRRMPASLSGTTMTHPEYNGRGIFSTLATGLYERITAEQGITAVMGFPNQNSHYALVRKIGWQDVAIVPTLSAPSSALSTATATRVDGLSVSPIARFTEAHETFAAGQIAGAGFRVSVYRSMAYLNWRYLDHPSNTYVCHEVRTQGTLAGFVISKAFDSFAEPGRREVDIVELLCVPEQPVINALMQHLMQAHNDASPVRFNCWMPVTDQRHLMMERIGFRPGMPLTYMGTKAFVPGLDEIYTFNNWYLSMGDSDVY